MATTTMTLTVKISFPWWGIHYARACIVIGLLFGLVPDEDKIIRRITRHVKYQVVSNG